MNYTTMASESVIAETIRSLQSHGVTAVSVDDESGAMEAIRSYIPRGASVMNGSSKTLEQIGFIAYLKGEQHGWNNLHESIVNEKNPEHQALLRKQALLSDYYLGSVHALTQTGEFVIASNTGSQLPHVVYSSTNLIFIVGTQKIVPTLESAFMRLEDHVVPLENERMMAAYGVGTNLSKVLIFKRENPIVKRSVRMILVRKKLGF